MTNEIQILKKFFDAKHLQVSEYYLQCCLEWIQSQFTTSSEKELCEKVYEQWLLVDLRELAVPALPAELLKQKKTVLNGTFAVQVMYFKDISKSSLSQLKNIRNLYKLTRANVDNEYNEPQGKRTLYLYITDGIEYIFAFEYETVSCLNINLPPGVKILLTGPLTIKNGEILLKNNNVKVLGGEVEDLLVCNAVENVLARELNLPENPNPGVVEEENVTNDTQSSTNQSTYSNSIPQNRQTNYANNNAQNIQTNYSNNNAQNRQQNQAAYNNNQRNNQNLTQQQLPTFNPSPSTSRIQSSNQNSNPDFADDDDAFMAQLADFEENFEEKRNNETNNQTLPKDFDEMHFDDELMDIEFNDHFDDFEKETQAKQVKLTFPVKVESAPFNYIKQLVDNSEQLIGKMVRVKAQFVGVVQKLTFSSAKGWTMKFKITDGTGVIVVDFLSVVLEELIGVSHEQALVLKQKIKSKIIGSSERIKEILYECKDKLTLLNCFMALKYIGQNDIPTVIWLKPILIEDFKNLKRRVDSIKNN